MRMVCAATMAVFSLLLLRSNAIPIKAEVQPCSAGFSAYNGWCISLSSADYWYEQAAEYCRSVGSFAPSLHSQQDVDFWAKSIIDLNLKDNHFWLDADCPSIGQPYVWRDGTPTDFLGILNVLASCDGKMFLHMHQTGLVQYNVDVAAPALCAYRADSAAPTTEAESTVPSTATPTDAPIDYCTCETSSVYLDVAFVVDASADMTAEIVGDAAVTIQAVLLGLTHGTEMFQTNVAAVAYAESVQIVSNFGDIRTINDILNFDVPYLGGNATKMREAIKKSTALISTNARNFTRGVIILLSKSFDQLDAVNIFAAAQEFKDNGGIFISIDYTNGGYVKGMETVASPGYYINDAKTPNNLVPDMLYALCDGCYRVADSATVYIAAEPNCEKKFGFVSTIHNADKNFFMTTLYPPRTPFWIGLQRSGSNSNFIWVDGVFGCMLGPSEEFAHVLLPTDTLQFGEQFFAHA